MVALTPSGLDHFIGGFRDDGTGTNNYYFNSVNVTGAVAAGASNTYAFRVTGTATVQLRDNIFTNTRSKGNRLPCGDGEHERSRDRMVGNGIR